jgi:ADP-ribosylation factor GTPase-activating protein 1
MSQCPEDAEAFNAIIAADAECKKCFECGYPNPQWCDINHGVFICLECSGVHRGLGTHLSFVRSSTMDGWTNWKPEKLRQMQIGGNRKARMYFESKGVPKGPIRARYEHEGALRYMSKLEAEAAGTKFDEAAWRPPQWSIKSSASSAGSNTARYQGLGSSGGGSGVGGRQQQSESDWFSALSSGWNTVAQKTAEVAQAAAATTATLVDQTAKQVEEVKVKEKASESLAAISSGWSWAIGNVAAAASSWTKPAPSSDDDDGLGVLTRNVGKSEQQFGSIEHRAEPPSKPAAGIRGSTWDDDDEDGFSQLKSALPRGTTYQGVGGGPATPVDASSAPRKQQQPEASPPPQTKKSDWEWDE